MSNSIRKLADMFTEEVNRRYADCSESVLKRVADLTASGALKVGQAYCEGNKLTAVLILNGEVKYKITIEDR